jgi:amino acid adenylation domain-containing protein
VNAHARDNPDAPAVIEKSLAWGDRVLTYGELQARSARLADILRTRGVSTDALVGVCLPRSFDSVIAALAAWHAGGAYIPLDPSYPPERLGFILEDAQAGVLVTTEELARRLPAVSAEIIDIAVLGPPLARPLGLDERSLETAIEVSDRDLAYVIYTSGSTGTPKGVEITHGSLANLVAWHCDAFSVTPADRASHLAGLGFDASVWEIWPYLASGACVHLADDVTRSSPELLRDWLAAERITIGFVPTPLAERMLFLEWPAQMALRLMLTGGDTLHHFPPPGLPFMLVNNYGPTECTVVATSGEIAPGDEAEALPSIGKPIINTQLYILDDALREAPSSAPGWSCGEIYIGGAGLARGYRNSPDLTSKKFISTTYGRLYKTGDLGRRLRGGEIQFLGRIDDQIKIHGYRIEPLEIVRALNSQPGIRDSVVVAREDLHGEKRLIGYLIADRDFDLSPAQLRASIGEMLPEYMIPAVFVRLESFPLTAHGKVDHAALPEPDDANTLREQSLTVPSTETEQRLAKMITGLLELEDVAADENFFMLGGHSLLGAQLVARVREEFRVQIGLRTLFAAPTIAQLSREIDRLSSQAEI